MRESSVADAASLDAPISPTHAVAAFITRTRYGDLPAAVVRSSKNAILDTLGVGLAGARADGSRIVRAYVESLGCGGNTTVFGVSLKAPARFAALANGAAMHADDYDDTFHPSRVHSSAPVAAATFAEAEARGASGKDVLTAFTVGTEVTCKISQAIDRAHYQRGYHATSTCGVFGAVAGVCSLRRLQLRTTLAALGIAGSESAGLRENFGTMMKPLHAGRAAESAVVAAELAQLGMTAASTILEGPRGFFMAGGGGYDLNTLLKLGEPWSYISPGVAVKPFPSGNIAHPAMCRLQDIVSEHDINPHEVKRIAVKTNRLIPLNLTYHDPETGLQGKFSMEFCLAAILVLRRAGLAEFTDDVVNRPDVREAIGKIECSVYSDDEAAANGYVLLTTFLDLEMKDGRRYSARADAARGSAELPMNESEIADKFRECAAFAGWAPGRAERVIDLIGRLDELDDVRPVARALGDDPLEELTDNAK
jgi:2-methylcitrate dehydratase PrpD